MTRGIVTALLTALALFLIRAQALGASSVSREGGVDSLLLRATRSLAQNTIDSRHSALRDLEEASRLASDRIDAWKRLAILSERMGRLDRSRDAWSHVAKLAPADGEPRLQLGRVWKWDWLSSLDESSYENAAHEFLDAARRDPGDPEPRIELAALALAKGNLDLARRAAESAVRCDPDGAESRLVRALVWYREGALARADSGFSEAIPLLSYDSRKHFAELGIIGGGRSDAKSGDSTTASSSSKPSFWEGRDPDLTTPENELELNFTARVAHALLLFRDTNGVRWDMRTELFVRYGLPSSVTYNPPTASLGYHYARYAEVYYAPDPLEYPYNMQVWSYPNLGMRVVLWDQMLDQNYQLPITTEHEADPRPNAEMIAGRSDLVLLDGGRGVYRAMPPGVNPMEVRAQISRFPGEEATRLVAQLEAPGGPADSLEGAWAVVDATGKQVARGKGALTVSTCDPAAQRIANFSAAVPPGDYRVDVTVDDHHGHRGLVHLASSVPQAAKELALSDLVLLCGSGAAAASQDAIRLEPAFEHRVGRSREVSVYFEVDRLAVGPDGRSRFSYAYRVRPSPRNPDDRALQPVFEATREDDQIGSIRRQFLTVPVESLKSGAYELEIEVWDLVSNGSVRGKVDFMKE